MANVLLTEACVRRCPYCFAKQYMDGEKDKTAISFENVKYIADFLEKSGENRVSLLGGEPLIHPHVGEIIKYFLDRKFGVTVFTSGIIPSSLYNSFADEIESIGNEEREKLWFIVNVNEPRFSNKKEVEKVHKFLEDFGSLSSLSFNIYRLDYNLDFLIDYIQNFGLRRRVRFGIANPIPNAKNHYIKPEDFVNIKPVLMESLGRMHGLGISVHLDCGFPMCMFTNEEIGKLYKYNRGALFFDCNPTIDIGPDLSCWACFPLSNINRKSLKDFSNMEETYEYFKEVMLRYRKDVKGIYLACDNCDSYYNNTCSGGCLAHTLNGFVQEGGFRTDLIQ